jgi:hypothetical protein
MDLGVRDLKEGGWMKFSVLSVYKYIYVDK